MEHSARVMKLKRKERELFTATIIRVIDFTSVASKRWYAMAQCVMIKTAEIYKKYGKNIT